jgi:N-acetylglucosamine kinase-like BadF-type ATPase
MGMTVLGVDGGNTKTDLVAATMEGTRLAYVRGPGSNSHGPGGPERCIAVIAALVEQAELEQAAHHGAFFLCGADVPADITALQSALETQPWVRSSRVDNDTFALLQLADGDDAVAIVCGGGINCVGRRADGRVSRYPSLGWETGNWGGAEAVGREALHHAARAEDGRGPDSALVEIVCEHFGLPSVLAVGEAVHYRRVPDTRLGELAPLVVAAAGEDAVAASIIERLTAELLVLIRRAAAELEFADFDVVLGGGMLADNASYRDAFVARLADELPRARPVVPDVPPVVGAVLAALAAVGAPGDAASTLRAAFADD